MWLLHLFLCYGKNTITMPINEQRPPKLKKTRGRYWRQDRRYAWSPSETMHRLQRIQCTSQTTISTAVLPCNCRKYCPAVNSNELEVSYRRLFSYMLMNEVVYWRNAIWVAVELYFLGQNVRLDKRVNNLNLVSSKFRHIETVEKSLSEKVSLGVQKILDREWSSFFPRSRAQREKK